MHRVAYVSLIKTDTLSENLINDPIFQQIVGDAEAKYRKEYQRVGDQLREIGYY